MSIDDNEPDYLDMSDEELDKIDVLEVDSENGPEVEEEVAVEAPESDSEEDSSEESDIQVSEEEIADTDDSVASEGEVGEEETKVESIDYEAMVTNALSPLTVVGKEIPINNFEDLRNLAQKGIRFTQNMQTIAPIRKQAKILKNNNIDEARLNYLIDLSNGNPEAIKQLVMDNKIDPMEMDLEKESEYKPETYNVSDAEVKLDEVIESIQDSPSFDETAAIISNKWDKKSRDSFRDNPSHIATLNEHVELGIFKQVEPYLEREKALGKLNGMSDFEAYQHVLDQMDQAGVFDAQTVEQPEIPVTKSVDKQKDQKIKQAKKAASSNKSAPTKKAVNVDEYDLLNMSDEEWAAYEKANPLF